VNAKAGKKQDMSEPTVQDRLVSLDVFRGLTIAGMTLVNNPGTWEHIYSPLEHAEWNGITPTDYVFPFFLFIVGVAIPIALSKRIAEGITGPVYAKIVARAASIFALGILISAIPFFSFGKTEAPQLIKLLITLGFSAALFFYFIDKKKIAGIIAGVSVLAIVGMYFAGTTLVWYNPATMRIPGVLQRIAVCYLIVSIIFLHTNWKQQAAIGGALLLLYWFLITAVDVPGCEVTTMNDKACNLAAYIDRLILTPAHLWSQAKVYDPEGILSTIPALVTTIAGVLTGTWLRSSTPAEGEDGVEGESTGRSRFEIVAGIFFAGTVLLAAGWSWSLIFPLNKALWTSSYVLYTAGLALLTLGFCFWLIDIKGYKKWATPFVIFGVNALALYVFSGIMSRILGALKVTGADGSPTSLQGWIFDNLFLTWASPINASLAFGLSYVLFWLLLMWLLYRKQIYIRV
jgi:predicted acyltransferase